MTAATRAPLARSALWRFMLALAGAFALASLVAGLLAHRAVDAYVRARVAEAIAADLDGLADVHAAGGAPALKQAIGRRVTAEPRRIYLLVDAQGEPQAGNVAGWPNNLPPDAHGLSFRLAERDDSFEGDARTLADGSRLLVAHSQADNRALRADLLGRLALPALAALALMLLASWRLARRALARIAAMNAACARVEAGEMTARVGDLASQDELGALARNIDAMLGRIEALMGGVQTLSDHIAHETRTPLARLRARLERARAASLDAPTRAAFDDAIAETQTIIDIFSALIDITATEAARGDAKGLVDVDLAETVARVVDLYEGVAEDRGVRLTAQTAPAHVLGDPTLLMRMVANVVDNAIKFSPAGGAVSITLASAGGEATLAVRDEGPGVPQAFRAAAFERFARADAARGAPGHGLGLTLVRAIAIRHGMKIALEDARPGLRVVIRATA